MDESCFHQVQVKGGLWESILCKVIKESSLPLPPLSLTQYSAKASESLYRGSQIHSFSGLPPDILIVASLHYVNHSLFQPKALRLFFARIILHIPVVTEKLTICYLLSCLSAWHPVQPKPPWVFTEIIDASKLIYLVFILLLSFSYGRVIFPEHKPSNSILLLCYPQNRVQIS